MLGEDTLEDSQDPLMSSINARAWSRPVEAIFAKWSDIALCYVWLHDRSHRKYKVLNHMFSIPIIVLSTLTGTANFGIGSVVPTEYTQLGQILIGTTSIFAGILGTLQNFFRFAQNSENHYNALQGWSKLQNNISMQLSLDRMDRTNVQEFMVACKTEFERLLESSPSIPMDVIKQFRQYTLDANDLVVPTEVERNLKHTEIQASSTTQSTLTTPSLRTKTSETQVNICIPSSHAVS